MTPNRNKFRLTLLTALTSAVIAILLPGCVPGSNDHTEFASLPSARWAYGDTIAFAPVLADSIATGSLLISLRHGNEYVYSNLWVEVTYSDSHHRLHRDTLDLVLADKFGKWRGHGMGTSFQTTDTVAPSVTLLRDAPSIKVRHIMRSDTIDGIYQLGIEFNESRK